MPDNYIEEAVATRANAVVYTMNGFQMRGTIVADCENYIVILSNGKKKMVYKHAISTIEPA